MALEIKMDFLDDWGAMVKILLRLIGIDPPPDKDAKELNILLYKNLHRQIHIKPRQVTVSKEFSCPPQHQNVVDEIKRKAQRGNDLGPYLSRNMKNPNYNDLMLNDWGVYHLHLGDTVESDGFVTGTGPLLFVRVTDDKIYFIDVMNHGDWNKEQIVKIVHDNWPDTIETYALKGVLPGDPISDTERKKLREAGINTFVGLSEEAVFAPIGGGSVMSGEPFAAMRRATETIRFIRQLEKELREKLPYIMDRSGLSEGNSFCFRLVFNEGCVCAVEEEHEILVRFHSAENTTMKFGIDFSVA